MFLWSRVTNQNHSLCSDSAKYSRPRLAPPEATCSGRHNDPQAKQFACYKKSQNTKCSDFFHVVVTPRRIESYRFCTPLVSRFARIGSLRYTRGLRFSDVNNSSCLLVSQLFSLRSKSVTPRRIELRFEA
jgi:hypothetical protein